MVNAIRSVFRNLFTNFYRVMLLSSLLSIWLWATWTYASANSLLQMLQTCYSLHGSCSSNLVICNCYCPRIWLHGFNWRNICQAIVDSQVLSCYWTSWGGLKKMMLWVILHRNRRVCRCVRRTTIEWRHRHSGHIRHGVEQRVQSSNSFNCLLGHFHLKI